MVLWRDRLSGNRLRVPQRLIECGYDEVKLALMQENLPHTHAPEVVPDASQQPAAAAARRTGGAVAWLRDVLLAVGVSAFIIIFLYQPVRVEGTSMLPNLEDQDRLFINKFAFRVGEIHRGDVVVFRYPRDETKNYIKRVIGLPGDRVRIVHGSVYVNGKLLPEPYVPARYTDDRSQPEIRIPADEYFVLGDHRNISSDSREFGPVERDLIYGKAAFVYWPFDQAGVVR
jgi:signal peptidase I